MVAVVGSWWMWLVCGVHDQFVVAVACLWLVRGDCGLFTVAVVGLWWPWSVHGGRDLFKVAMVCLW